MQMNQCRVAANLRRLRILLSPTNKSIFVCLSVAGEAIDLRVWSQRAFIVNVAAANSPDTPCIHWLTAVLYFGHGRKKASWLARIANVSELVDSPKSKLLLRICCRIKQRRRHDFSTWTKLSSNCFLFKMFAIQRYNCQTTSNILRVS